MSPATPALPHKQKIVRMVPVYAYGSDWLGKPATQVSREVAKLWVDCGAAEWGSRTKSIRLRINRMPGPQLSLTMNARSIERLAGTPYLATLQSFWLRARAVHA